MSPRASAVLLLGLVGCSRTPPEPAPAASTSPATTVSQAPLSAPVSPPPRCVTAAPSAAPALPKPAVTCPPDPEAPRPLPTAQVGFPDAAGSPRVDVELAMTPHDIEKGLMYRRAMPEDRGMLFKLQDRRDHTFWMQNTCIPLDMMFVDEDGLIVGIVEGAEPLTTSERAVGCPSVYVLEVNGGWSRRHGVRPGQRLGLPAVVR
jgi:uncharacterized protein